MDWKKIFQIMYLIKELYLDYIKTSQKLTIRNKLSIVLKIGKKYLSRYYTKEDLWM